MGIKEVREGLAALLVGVEGVKSASGYPTENTGAEPFAYVGFDDDAIVASQRELDLHQLPIYVFVTRAGGNLPNQVKAAEALIGPIRDAMRTTNTLGGAVVDRIEPTRVREGIYSHAGVDYVGFILDVTIKESRGVSYG